jgi:hydrogenase maturation protease
MLLIGLGNPLMSDEGIGVLLLAEIEARGIAPPTVECQDMGTAGIGLLHIIGGRDKVVFIDCALMGEEPGTIRRFTPDEVVSHKIATRRSLHEGDLINTLALAKRLGEYPKEVVIFGVEPESVEPGQGLSPTLACQMEHYLAVVGEEWK